MTLNIIDLTETLTTPEQRSAYNDFLEQGFSPEIAAVGMALSLEIDRLKERLDKLEK